MQKLSRCSSLIAVIALLSPLVAATSTQEKIWGELAPYFTPPAEYVGIYDDYRSPLFFENGAPVRTADEWKERRQEILTLWHGWMGEWPPLMTEQKLKVTGEKKIENYTQQDIEFKWTPTETTQGYLLLPEGKGPHPAVITVFYNPEAAVTKGERNRDFAYQLVKRGFAALSLGTTKESEARTFALYYPSVENSKVEGLSMLAYAAANAWHVLANHAEIDSTRIGIAGHSFGGKWAMFASCLFDKFAAAAWSDPGIVFDLHPTNGMVNYWEPWYLGYHRPPWRKRGVPTKDNPARGLYLKLVEQHRDLHELHALMAPRPFLVSGGSSDPPKQWIPLNHSIAVNELLGYSHRVGMTNRKDHSPNEESNKVLVDFFDYFLMQKGNLRINPPQ